MHCHQFIVQSAIYNSEFMWHIYGTTKCVAGIEANRGRVPLRDVFWDWCLRLMLWFAQFFSSIRNVRTCIAQLLFGTCSELLNASLHSSHPRIQVTNVYL